MTDRRRTLPVLAATVGLILLPHGVLHAHAEETPEERCQRETQAYNDAWKRQWSQSHPDAVAAGQAPPPPPVPYRCYGTPSITPTPIPAPPPGGTNGAGGPANGGAPTGGHTDPITGLPPNVPPLNQPAIPGNSGYHAGNPPHNTPGQPDYNPTNPWVDGRRTGTPSTPPLNHPTPTNNPHHKQGIDRPNLGDWHPTPPETHPLNHPEKSSGIKNNKHSEATHFWQQLVDNLTPNRHTPPRQDATDTSSPTPVDNTAPTRSATSTDGKRLPAENNTATDSLTLLLMTAGLLSGLHRRKAFVYTARSETQPPLSPNRKKAVAYAEKWARGRNPDYPTRPTTAGADCTNFASQVLHAGGFKEEPAPTNKNDKSTRYWASYKNVELPSASYGPPIETIDKTRPTRSWNNADALYHRLVETNRGKVVGRVQGQYKEGNNLSPSQHGLQPGDLIFYEDSQSHKMTHVAVYMGTKNGVDIVNQHSSAGDKHDYHDNWQTDTPRSKDRAVFVHVYYPGEPRR